MPGLRPFRRNNTTFRESTKVTPSQKVHLKLPTVAAIIDKLHAGGPGGWRKNRLLAAKLAARGDHSTAEIPQRYENFARISPQCLTHSKSSLQAATDQAAISSGDPQSGGVPSEKWRRTIARPSAHY